ncbi:MAG: hypothetical protein WCW87_02785 [Candidatus Paceibacterota bacterium]
MPKETPDILKGNVVEAGDPMHQHEFEHEEWNEKYGPEYTKTNGIRTNHNLYGCSCGRKVVTSTSPLI